MVFYIKAKVFHYLKAQKKSVCKKPLITVSSVLHFFSSLSALKYLYLRFKHNFLRICYFIFIVQNK